MSTLTISNEVFDPSHLLEANEPITPPPSLSQLHSFLSFSPSPTPPRRTYPLPSRLNLQPPIQLLSPTLASPESNFNDLNNKEYDELSSPTFSLLSSTLSTRGGGGGFSSRNPFLAILIAQQAEGEGIESALSASQDTVPSSALPEVSSQEGDISQTTGSRLESPISREEKEEEETEHRIVFSEGADGESFSDVLQEIASDCDGSSSKDWEEEMDGEELAFSHPFASEIRESSKVIEVQSEEQPSTPVTPILSITPSSPDQTPRAKLSSSPSKRRSVSSPRSRRQSVITASSPRRYRVSPRRSSTATAAVTTATSRRSSIAPQSSSLIQGFNYYPTSPLHSLQHSPTIPSSRTPSFSPKKKKSQPSSSKSRSRTSSRPPPSRLRPVEAFDAEALDLFFGVTKSVSKARRGGYETAAREAGVLSGKVGIGEEEKEREQWRKVEEFRGLLDQAATQESEDEIEEEEVEEGEVLHIKASPVPSSQLFLSLPCPTRPTSHRSRRRSTPRSPKKKKSRPPPLQLSHSNNSFTSSSSSTSSLSFDISGGESSSFSPDTPRSPRVHPSSSSSGSLDSPIILETSSASSSGEISRRRQQGLSTTEPAIASTAKVGVGLNEKSLKKKKSVGDRLRNLCRF